jgi:uncharacterized membrane protein (GlpM family)
LQLVFTRPNLEPTFSQIANGRVLMANLLQGVRMGLLFALHSIFLYAAGIMAVALALSLFLRDGAAAQKEL